MFSIDEKAIDPEKLSRELAHCSAGALSTFEGWVRDKNDGHAVRSLEYECYSQLAQKEGVKIIEEAKERFDIVEASCRHRVGNLEIGELAVWVGATAVHRAEAFAACRYVIDEIKLRLPVWKKEHYVDGSSTWVNCSQHEHQKHELTQKGLEQNQEIAAPDATPPKPVATESSYYSRQISLQEIGVSGQRRLKNSSVLVIGAGGTGCPALQYLVGAGVGKLGICDFDQVEITNLHRQPLYTTADLGRKKAEAAAERLRASNPFVLVQSIAQKFDATIAARLVRDYDVILDCTDNLEAKFCIANVCRELAKTFLQASVHGFEGELLLWQPAPKVTGEKKTTDAADYSGQCYSCLWPSPGALQENGRDCVMNCAESGVLGVVPGLLGTMQATEALKILLGIESTLSKHLLLVDLQSLALTKIKVRRDANCPACGSTKGGLAESEVPIKKAGKAEQNSAEDESIAIDADASNENEFELHWSILQGRSPRDLVYVDIRTQTEKDNDPTTRNKLKGRQLLEWAGDTLDLNEVKLDRNLTYLFICQRGKRSGTLVRKLRALGHRNVFSLSEGVQSMSPKNSERAKV